MKQELILKIKKKGFPQAYQKGEADGTITYYLPNENEIKSYDYGEGVDKLEDLEIDELTSILKHSFKEGEEDYDMIMESIEDMGGL